MNRDKPEPLLGHPRYEKVRLDQPESLLNAHSGPRKALLRSGPSRAGAEVSGKLGSIHKYKARSWPQIRDLNSGTFGFVQLARDKSTGELIAIKFIERGDKVRSRAANPPASSSGGAVGRLHRQVSPADCCHCMCAPCR